MARRRPEVAVVAFPKSLGRWACGLLLLLPVVTAAAAQGVSPETVRAQTGEWLVAPDDGNPGCRIRLGTERTIGGFAATPNPDCKARQPKLADVASWSFVARGLSLNDATRRPIMVFAEDEAALLKTRGGERPNYLMVRAKPGIDRAPHAAAIFGVWTMTRPNGPAICTVTFRDGPPPGGEESFALALDPKCDPAIRRLKLASWRVEDFALVLYGTDGESLGFEPAPGGGFAKAAREGGRPLLLSRAR